MAFIYTYQRSKQLRCVVVCSMSSGEDFITSDQLQDRMSSLDKQREDKEESPEDKPSTSHPEDSTGSLVKNVQVVDEQLRHRISDSR